MSPCSVAKRQTPSRQTFSYSSSSTAPNHLSCCPLVGVGGRRCVRPACVIESSTPGRSQMSRVLYKVLRFVPTSNTGLTSLHLREGLKDPEGLMCRDRVRCWPRPGRAPWRRRCGKFLCRLSAYRILILMLMLTRLRRSFNAPVSSFWKANSTLLASKAEVSMKESPFSLAKLLAYAENRVSIVSQKSWVASLCHIPPPWAQPEGASNRSCFPPA
jgi:hypothetical protein